MKKLNPLTSLISVLSTIMITFIVPLPLFSVGVFTIFVIPISLFTKSFRKVSGVVIRFVLPFSIFLFTVHCFLLSGDEHLIIYGIDFNISGFNDALLISSRVAVMVGSITILFNIYNPVEITRELALRKVPMSPLYVINTTIQILPRMKKRAETIREAQRARGLEIRGNILQRLKALLPLSGPLFFGLFKEVEQRALVLEIRDLSDSKSNISFKSKDSRLEKIFRISCIITLLTALVLRVWIQFA